MKKKLLVLFSVLFLVISLSGMAYAVPVSEGQGIKVNNHPDYGNASFGNLTGGPFLATLAGGVQFLTYCVELNESLTFGAWYTVGAINTKTDAGGVYLSDFSAWLYTQSLKGSYDATEMVSVQHALWEEFKSGTSYTIPAAFNTFYLAQKSAFNQAVSDGKWTSGSIGNVRVLNIELWENGQITKKQDILVKVPEPGTALLIGGIFLGLGVFGRRRFIKK